MLLHSTAGCWETTLKRCERLATAIGTWPKGHQWFIKPFRFYVIVSYSIFFTISLLEVIHNWGDIEALTDTAQYTGIIVVTFHKWIVMFHQHEMFRSLIHRINRNFGLPEQRTDNALTGVIKSCMKNVRMLSNAWTTMVVVAAIIIAIMPGATRLLTPATAASTSLNANNNSTEPTDVASFPLRNWTPFDESSPLMYGLWYTFHITIEVLSVYMITLFDSLYFAFILHACAQYSILQISLQTMNERVKHKVGETSGKGDLQVRKESEATEVEMRAYVKKCVRHHNALNKFMEDVESVVSLVFLNQILSSSVIICMTAFQVAVSHVWDMKKITMTVTFCAALFEIYMFCLLGDRVMAQSKQVGFAAYESDWFNMPPAVQRSLLLITVRSSKATHITFGKFLPLSLPSYANIIQSIYTYLAMLIQLNE